MLPNVFQFTGLGFPVLRVQQNCWLSWLTHFQHQVVEKEFTAEAVTVKTSQGNVSILHSFIYSLGLNVKCCHESEKDFVSSCPPPWFAYCSNSDVTPFTACHNLGPLQLPHLPFLRLSGRLLPACEMRTGTMCWTCLLPWPVECWTCTWSKAVRLLNVASHLWSNGALTWDSLFSHE